MYEINRAPRYKSLWFSSKDATMNPERNQMTFGNMPLIQIRGEKCYMRLNSIAMDSASAGNYTGHTWTLKVQNVKYNGDFYRNSDKNAIPTLSCFMVDSVGMMNSGMNNLMIDEQDINSITFLINSNDGHGLVKNSQNVELHFNIVIEEYD